MTNFGNFGLPATLMRALAHMSFDTPTPIQEKTIPLALEGRDILGSAQTGTGKTGAFAIPLLTQLINNPRGSALVLTPTRELAAQVVDTMRKMLSATPSIKTALLIGGESLPKQCFQLKARPRLIVGTPGRINDHLARGSLMLHDTHFLVLDETDRMLDMGFGIQLENIVKYLPKTRQTLMFSATLPVGIVKLSKNYLHNPERISVDSTTTPAPKIQQEIIHTSEEDKYDHLLTQLNQRDGSIIVFVKTKRSAERLAEKLRKQKYSAEAIHGDLQQRQRTRVIQSFRDKLHRIMIATDIAARGLDIPHIEHVINFDLPQCPEDYIHRIGRTARAGASGAAVCLVSPEDGRKWKAIHKLMHPGEASPRIEGGNSSRPGGKPSQGKRRFFGGGRSRSNGSGNGNGNNNNSNNSNNNSNRPRSSRPKRRAA